MPESLVERNLVSAADTEQPALVKIEALLHHQRAQPPRLVGQGGEEVVLPDSVQEVLRRAVDVLAHGETVAIGAANRMLTTNEAADVLNVSRPYLIRLLERGDMPFTMVGTHRRLLFTDVLAYKRVRDLKRDATLDRLAELSEEIGLYGHE